MMTKNRLVGTWRLLSHEMRGEDGSVHHAYGENPVGYIMYGQDGYMHVAFMKADRPRISNDTLSLATTEEKAWAAVHFESYCGKYDIKGNKVFHHVEVSLNPNWVGSVQERDVQLKGDMLVLSLPMSFFGVKYTASLTWKRV